MSRKKKGKMEANNNRGEGQYDGFVFMIEIFITIILLLIIYFVLR